MTINDEEARKARARQLRQAIEEIRTPPDKADAPAEETPASKPESPRDYIHRKMNEIDRKGHP